MDTKSFLSIYNAYKQGDLTIRTFCQTHNIPTHTFCYWRNKLLTENSSKISVAKPSAKDFIEIIPSSPKRSAKYLSPPSFSNDPSNKPPQLQIQIGFATFILADGFSKTAFIQSLQALQEARLC